MLTSILSAVCALALGSSAMTSQADTVNVYMINGEKVTNFDGSQLCGKTVSDYRIGVATNNATGEVSKVHIIKTEEHVSPLKVNGVQVMGQDVIYVVDGVKTSSLDFIKIKQENIGSMTVCKAGSEEAMEWTDDENVNVIKFETKKENIYIIDGKQVSSDEFSKFKSNDISSMKIYKAGSEESAKWTGNKDRNVILIELKK
jgi:hypothetical protein